MPALEGRTHRRGRGSTTRQGCAQCRPTEPKYQNSLKQCACCGGMERKALSLVLQAPSQQECKGTRSQLTTPGDLARTLYHMIDMYKQHDKLEQP
jgi:hypothetical protein